MSIKSLDRSSPLVRRNSSVEILFPQHVTKSDWQFLGRDFSDSKVMMARRHCDAGADVKAVAAFRQIKSSFYVHSFWADGAMDNEYDGEAIAILIFHLRKLAADLGYADIDFQCMSEMWNVFAFLQMHCLAVPIAIVGTLPAMRR